MLRRVSQQQLDQEFDRLLRLSDDYMKVTGLERLKEPCEQHSDWSRLFKLEKVVTDLNDMGYKIRAPDCLIFICLILTLIYRYT